MNKYIILLSIILASLAVVILVIVIPLLTIENLREDYKELSLKYNLSQEEVEKLNRMDLIEFTPSLQEVRKILEEDKINEIPYTDDFTCIDFSFGLIQNFFKKKVYACAVYMIFGETAHAIVAVNTTEGIIYIEPQTDDIIFNLKEGDDYCKKINWDCNWKIIELKSCFGET